MSFPSIAITDYAAYPSSREKLPTNGSEVLKHTSLYERNWQIVAAVISAVAAAVFAAIVVLAIVGLTTGALMGTIFMLAPFVLLASALIAGVSAVALGALAITKSIQAHRNLTEPSAKLFEKHGHLQHANLLPNIAATGSVIGHWYLNSLPQLAVTVPKKGAIKFDAGANNYAGIKLNDGTFDLSMPGTYQVTYGILTHESAEFSVALFDEDGNWKKIPGSEICPNHYKTHSMCTLVTLVTTDKPNQKLGVVNLTDKSYTLGAGNVSVAAYILIERKS